MNIYRVKIYCSYSKYTCKKTSPPINTIMSSQDKSFAHTLKYDS